MKHSLPEFENESTCPVLLIDTDRHKNKIKK
jgi:hypothetical protein